MQWYSYIVLIWNLLVGRSAFLAKQRQNACFEPRKTCLASYKRAGCRTFASMNESIVHYVVFTVHLSPTPQSTTPPRNLNAHTAYIDSWLPDERIASYPTSWPASNHGTSLFVTFNLASHMMTTERRTTRVNLREKTADLELVQLARTTSSQYAWMFFMPQSKDFFFEHVSRIWGVLAATQDRMVTFRFWRYSKSKEFELLLTFG